MKSLGPGWNSARDSRTLRQRGWRRHQAHPIRAIPSEKEPLSNRRAALNSFALSNANRQIRAEGGEEQTFYNFASNSTKR
jgi:hypothetical protein